LTGDPFADNDSSFAARCGARRLRMPITAKDALIVVDVQNDFVSGTMAIPNAKAIIDPINALAATIPNVVVATDWHPVGHVSLASSHPGRRHGDVISAFYGEQRLCHDHCLQQTWGSELDPDLRLGMAQLILRKGYRPEVDSYGAFYENDGVTATGLGAYLHARGIQRVFCAGLARLGCVMQTALGGARDGFDVIIVDDAAMGTPRRPEDEAKALRQLADAGVRWMTSDGILRAESAGHNRVG
jgi:nicotinamidase/pyrazinamidase